MRTWCICDELPVFLGGCGLVMESLKREWPFVFCVSVPRSDTGAPSLVDLGVLG